MISCCGTVTLCSFGKWYQQIWIETEATVMKFHDFMLCCITHFDLGSWVLIVWPTLIVNWSLRSHSPFRLFSEREAQIEIKLKELERGTEPDYLFRLGHLEKSRMHRLQVAGEKWLGLIKLLKLAFFPIQSFGLHWAYLIKLLKPAFFPFQFITYHDFWTMLGLLN